MDTKRDNLWRDMSTTIYDIFLKNGDFAAKVLAFRAPFLDPPKASGSVCKRLEACGGAWMRLDVSLISVWGLHANSEWA